jgi:hypothetical protein
MTNLLLLLILVALYRIGIDLYRIWKTLEKLK